MRFEKAFKIQIDYARLDPTDWFRMIPESFKIVNISTHDGYLTLDAVDCSKCFKFGGLVLLAI